MFQEFTGHVSSSIPLHWPIWFIYSVEKLFYAFYSLHGTNFVVTVSVTSCCFQGGVLAPNLEEEVLLLVCPLPCNLPGLVGPAGSVSPPSLPSSLPSLPSSLPSLPSLYSSASLRHVSYLTMKGLQNT